jgi:GrpB-like predicted nucleotidyltransferase (UPF0157 family)
MRAIVVPYNPDWPNEFAGESKAIAAAFGDIRIAIHHIGSTSIPGMHAKPIIDMLAVVSSIDAVNARNEFFISLGYEPLGEFGIPGRRYFRKNNPAGVRTHQIHAFQIGSPQIKRHLAFRDFLCTHPAEAAEYAALKRRLAEEHPDDIEAYMDGKDGFIKEMDGKAATWRADETPKRNVRE